MCNENEENYQLGDMVLTVPREKEHGLLYQVSCLTHVKALETAGFESSFCHLQHAAFPSG